MRTAVPVVAALLMMGGLRAHSASEHAQIRVICQTDWRDDMLNKPPPQSGRTFDVAVSLRDLSAQTTPRELLAIAEKRAGVRAPSDFINTFRVYRPAESGHTYQRIEHRKVRDTSPVLAMLRDGDIVVFHGVVDRL
jgi:hypothetical protein